LVRVWTQSANHPAPPHVDAQAARAIVCLHGAESHSEWFGPFALSALESGQWSDVIALDRPGWRGDLRARRDAWDWIARSLGGLGETRCHDPVDLVATSWGALALLSFLIENPGHAWGRVKSIHLVAPGIFPARKLQRRMVSQAIKDSLSGRGFVSGRLRTMIEPADFSSDLGLCAWIAADAGRNTELSLGFWATTARMRRVVTRAIKSNRLQSILRDTGLRVFLHVAEFDDVIDLSRTTDLLGGAGVRVFRYPARSHAIAMQYPRRLVEAIMESREQSTGSGAWNLEVFHSAVPFRLKVRHSHMARSSNDAIAIRISGHTRDGRLVRGIGEALPRSYVTGETAEGAIERCRELFQDLAIPVLRRATMDPLIPDVIDALIASWREASARGCLATWAAFDIALIDWISRATNTPVRQLVQMIARRSGVQSSNSETSFSVGAVAPRRATIPMVRPVLALWMAAVYRLAGYKLLKVKVGDPDSVARVRSVMRILTFRGRGCDVSLDANQGYHLNEARQFVDAVMASSPEVRRKLVAFEDPVCPSDAKSLAEFSGYANVPLMADEWLAGEKSFQAMARSPGVATWNVRLAKCGGVTGSLMACAAAVNAGARIVIGAMVGQGPVLDAVSRYVEQTVPVAWSESSFSSMLLGSQPFLAEKGFKSGTENQAKVGLGLKLSDAVLRRHLVSYRAIHPGQP
jgi:L-alanine-DL-glutamate epimerase-like enolase superfamily enzyme/pimeloyl-ACP methyl ester carboxylesterase